MFSDLQRQLDEALRKPGPVSNFLYVCEEKSGFERSTIVYGGVFLLFLYLLLGYGANALVLLVGFIYPAYQSVKAIETESKEDDTQWLIYWVSFASLQLFEAITFSLTQFIPFYPILKCLFLLHCMAPIPQNGSTQVYNYVIRPLFLKHSPKIDAALDTAVEVAEQLVEESYRKFERQGNIRCGACGRLFDTARGLSCHRRIHRY
ncbi:Receptor expression-enhancing protein 5, variant 2 [Clonorchis sinensis]|uniref:Receptor expression-enhancing protein n=1 Tax=Clonorchis sinensis TaxID=79923 RepID=A0A8T1LUE1_CLOSI|nr:Receptor expression-enhancing protein 5, variant 2 [Clonorchis sinensis]